jgi:hypothetical protein
VEKEEKKKKRENKEKSRKEKYNSKGYGLMLGFADLMLACWLEVSCIWKVLRPANSIKVFRTFPWSQSKC